MNPAGSKIFALVGERCCTLHETDTDATAALVLDEEHNIPTSTVAELLVSHPDSLSAAHFPAGAGKPNANRSKDIRIGGKSAFILASRCTSKVLNYNKSNSRESGIRGW
jgi:hypothetical protein